MPGPNVSLDQTFINDSIYKALDCINTSIPNVEDLKDARRILLELSQYIIQAPVKDANQNSLPRINLSRR